MKKLEMMLSLLLVFALVFSVSGIAAQAAADTDVPVRVITLNGTTGFGLAGLIAASETGKTDLNYSFTVESDPSNVTAALVSGDCDIAALPTNAAAALYSKTGGKVQVIALNTLGVLYLVTDGKREVSSFADLEGQAVYAPAQNPTFIFGALCEENGVDVTIDNSYAQPAELNTAAAAGKVGYAVLPEPMVSIAGSQNSDLEVVMDLTEEWDKVFTPGSLVQGCAVVRTEFAAEHPDLVEEFLADYADSVALVNDDPAQAAKDIETAGIFQKAAIAEMAIPKCNICFITGDQMKTQLNAFYEIMFEAAPQSIGGSVPGDDFYFIVK